MHHHVERSALSEKIKFQQRSKVVRELTKQVSGGRVSQLRKKLEQILEEVGGGCLEHQGAAKIPLYQESMNKRTGVGGAAWEGMGTHHIKSFYTTVRALSEMGASARF